MADKLSEIMAWKRREIAGCLRPVTDRELARLDAGLPRPPDFRAALGGPGQPLAVIAEIKRRSPSAGDIARGASAPDKAALYRSAGANALSVLTDEKFFGGSLDDLRAVTGFFREHPPAVPCLRKDFMVHPIQVLEARAAGASAVLIILRALEDEEVTGLHFAARAAGLAALFEVHDEDDVARAVRHGAGIIGVNNRDLATFKTDLALTEKLLPLVPPGIIAVSESGIFTPQDAWRARGAGAHAVLVGEALMKAPSPADLLAAFRSAS